MERKWGWGSDEGTLKAVGNLYQTVASGRWLCKNPKNRVMCETAQRHLAPMCETALRHLAPHAQDPNQKETIALWFGSNRTCLRY